MIFGLTEKMREESTNGLGVKMVNVLPLIYQPKRKEQEASETSAADLRCQTRNKLS